MNAAEHLEKYLGPIDIGWSPDVASGDPVGVRVCRFRERPHRDTTTYATLGLSDHALELPGGRRVRMELVLAIDSRQDDDSLAALLFHVAASVVQHHCALLRGQVVPLGHPVLRGSTCMDLYVSLPVAFPEGFSGFDDTDPETIIAWLIPVTPQEAKLVERQGWSALESKMEDRETDLFDYRRDSCV